MTVNQSDLTFDCRLLRMERRMAESTLTVRLAVRPFLEINSCVGVYGGVRFGYRLSHMESAADATLTTRFYVDYEVSCTPFH